MIQKSTHTRPEQIALNEAFDVVKVDSTITKKGFWKEMYGFKLYSLIELYLRFNQKEGGGGHTHRSMDRYARKVGRCRLMERVARWYEKNPNKIVDSSYVRIYIRRWDQGY